MDKIKLIRTLRRKHEISQVDLGRAVGLTSGKYISHIESGHRGCSDEYAQKLLEALNFLITKKTSKKWK